MSGMSVYARSPKGIGFIAGIPTIGVTGIGHREDQRPVSIIDQPLFVALIHQLDLDLLPPFLQFTARLQIPIGDPRQRVMR